MTKFFLVANPPITSPFLTTFFHSSFTRNTAQPQALRKGMISDVTRIGTVNGPVTDHAAMSMYKGALFSEVQVFRERA